MALDIETYNDIIQRAKDYAADFVLKRTNVRVLGTECSSSFVKKLAIALDVKCPTKGKREYAGIYLLRSFEKLGIIFPDVMRVDWKKLKKDAKKIRRYKKGHRKSTFNDKPIPRIIDANSEEKKLKDFYKDRKSTV
jgi:hypothetical protein